MDELRRELAELEQKLQLAKGYKEKQQKFDIEAEERFQNNLSAFEEYYPDIFNSIKNYQPAKDFKVFVTESGHGNYIPKGVSVPIYGQDPIAQAEQQVEKYTKKPNFGQSQLYGSPSASIKSDTRLHLRYLCKLAETFSELPLQDEPALESLPPHYPTCLMFGVGLGYQLPILLEKHSFDYIFLCEPDFETFFASLYCTDWKALLGKVDQQGSCLFIQVGVSYKEFFSVLRNIYERIGAFSLISSFCYQHTPIDEVNRLIKEFFNNFYQVQFGFGFYNDAITGLAHAIHNIENKANFLVSHKAEKDKTKSMPVFIVGNGPSLDKAAEVIREYQDRAVIFAAGTALQSLIKLGVKADFHVLVERTKVTYDVVCETIDPQELKKTNLLAVDVMYPDVLDMYQWSGLGLKGPEAATVFIQRRYLEQHKQLLPALPYAAPVVANTALSFAYMMGFKEVYLFGVDNGYPSTGESHSKFSIYQDTSFSERLKVDSKGEYELPGNIEGTVKATTLLAMAHQQIELLLKSSKGLEVYNVGQGAFIEGATPLLEEDVLCVPSKINKQDLVETLKKEQFEPLSSEGLEEALDIDEFTALCDHLLDIGQVEISTREQANDILKRQSRVVFAYKKSKSAHLFHLIKGTLLYFHCPLISLLYRFESEERSVSYFKECFKVWQECITAMRDDFPVNWDTKCGHSWEVAQHQKSLDEKTS